MGTNDYYYIYDKMCDIVEEAGQMNATWFELEDILHDAMKLIMIPTGEETKQWQKIR